MGESDIAYLPIRLGVLRVDTVTDFDLYLRTKEDSEVILYRQKDLPFDEPTRQRLLDHQVEELYVPKSQEGSYYRYLEQNMDSLLVDDSIPASDRMELLYDSAQNTVHEVLDDPGASDIMPRSQSIVEHVVNFVFSEPSSFGHFLNVAAIDYQTFTHSLNVFVYSINLAQRLGTIDTSLLMEFGTGALLHDIGKCKVDKEILQSTGALTASQWAVIKQHPVWGEEILRDHGIESELILSVTRSHHEKLDGSGYPDGLSGDQVSSLVRVSTICDIFDAVTTKRSYKQAMGSFPTLKLMKEDMTTELDQAYFGTFVKMMADSPNLIEKD